MNEHEQMFWRRYKCLSLAKSLDQAGFRSARLFSLEKSCQDSKFFKYKFQTFDFGNVPELNLVLEYKLTIATLK